MPPPDETEFRSLRAQLTPTACVFERALLSRCAACSMARPGLLAEREMVGCGSPAASARCSAYRDRLRANALFALRIDAAGPWPFGKEIRLQCGGLIGLQQALCAPEPEAEDREDAQEFVTAPVPGQPLVADVDALLSAALAAHGSPEALPYSQIMRAVVGYSPRRRVPR
jgi:hypothetical protein